MTSLLINLDVKFYLINVFKSCSDFKVLDVLSHTHTHLVIKLKITQNFQTIDVRYKAIYVRYKAVHVKYTQSLSLTLHDMKLRYFPMHFFTKTFPSGRQTCFDWITFITKYINWNPKHDFALIREIARVHESWPLKLLSFKRQVWSNFSLLFYLIAVGLVQARKDKQSSFSKIEETPAAV